MDPVLWGGLAALFLCLCLVLAIALFVRPSKTAPDHGVKGDGNF